MSAGELSGSVGVFILLLAFALNLTNKLSADSRIYLTLNTVGAALACFSSYLISFWPFVVLEGVWAIASLIIFIKTFRNV